MHLVQPDATRTGRDRLLKLPEVEHIAGIKKSTIYALMAEGNFPQRVRITRRLSVWPESEVFEWVNARIRASRDQEATQ